MCDLLHDGGLVHSTRIFAEAHGSRCRILSASRLGDGEHRKNDVHFQSSLALRPFARIGPADWPG